MTKTKQNFILFIEPPVVPWSSPSKIAHSYMNRFSIDEEAGFELLGVYNLSIQSDRFYDLETIGSAMEKAARCTSKNETKRLNTQLIIAENFLIDFNYEVEIAYAMKVHKIRNIIVTKLKNDRQHLITKEMMEIISKGKYYNVRLVGNHFTNKSVSDDLESVYKSVKFRNFRRACTNRYGYPYFVKSYCLPKLTNTELKLMKMKDKDYLKTFSNSCLLKHPVYKDGLDNENPDVDETEMKLSESKSKFVLVECYRWTFIMTMTRQKPSIYPTRRDCWTKGLGTDWERWLSLTDK